MDFKTATLSQLHLIVSEFEDCPIWYKHMAANEIKRRRKKRRYARLHCKEIRQA